MLHNGLDKAANVASLLLELPGTLFNAPANELAPFCVFNNRRCVMSFKLPSADQVRQIGDELGMELTTEYANGFINYIRPFADGFHCRGPR